MDRRWFGDLGTMEVLGDKPCLSDSKRTGPRSSMAFRGDGNCSTDVSLRNILRRVRKIAKKRLFASSCLPASPHGTTRLPLTDFHEI
jgi:hypothetical protein